MYLQAVIDAQGNGQGYLGPVPPGYGWYVERWTARQGAAAVFELAVLSVNKLDSIAAWDRVGRQDWSAAAINARADLNSPIYVPETYYLVGVWTGGTQGNAAVASLQVAVHQVDVRDYSAGRDTNLQVRAGYAQQFEHDGLPVIGNAFPPDQHQE